MRLQLCEFKKHGRQQRGFAHLVEFNNSESIIEIMDENGGWYPSTDKSITQGSIRLKSGPLSFIDMDDRNSIEVG